MSIRELLANSQDPSLRRMRTVKALSQKQPPLVTLFVARLAKGVRDCVAG